MSDLTYTDQYCPIAKYKWLRMLSTSTSSPEERAFTYACGPYLKAMAEYSPPGFAEAVPRLKRAFFGAYSEWNQLLTDEKVKDAVRIAKSSDKYTGDPVLGTLDGYSIEDQRERLIATILSYQYFDASDYGRFRKFLADIAPPVQIGLETFAFPTHQVMFMLLAMFAGKSTRIPNHILRKSPVERTSDEQHEVDDFLKSVSFEKTSNHDYRNGNNRSTTVLSFQAAKNMRVSAKAETELGSEDPRSPYIEESLALYVKRSFGPEGLRHLMGLLIALEDNQRKPVIEWHVNDHLKRLGCSRKKNGSYDRSQKNNALNIVQIFASFCFTIKYKVENKEIRLDEPLFAPVGLEIAGLAAGEIPDTLKLRATDLWYTNAVDAPKGAKSPKYNKLLQKIAHENHREHPYTIFLVPLLAIWWRMNNQQVLSVRNLMEWCDLDPNGRTRVQDLRKLESELDYMVTAGYLGDWTNTGDHERPSECREPFKCVLTLSPPKWMTDNLKGITAKKQRHRKTNHSRVQLTHHEFKLAFQKSGLSAAEFARLLNVSPATISLVLRGNRKISPDLESKLRKVFPGLTSPNEQVN